MNDDDKEELLKITMEYMDNMFPQLVEHLASAYRLAISERALFMMGLLQHMLNSGQYVIEFNNDDIEAIKGYLLKVDSNDDDTLTISVVFPGNEPES